MEEAVHQAAVSEAEKTVVREQLRAWKQTQPKIALKVTPAAVQYYRYWRNPVYSHSAGL